jgi:short-subunit dehydrogenase
MAHSSSNQDGAGRTALITGASSGIGAAFAEVFSQHGFDTVLVARRETRLRDLANRLTEKHGITARAIAADLADPGAPAKIQDKLETDSVTVDALVNNAGYGIAQDFLDTPWEEQARFIQVLATAPAHLTRLFLPGMVERGYGRIINTSSVAALLPGMAGHTLYSGVKSFLVKTSQSLMIELRSTGVEGVHVTSICPGFTHSEYHDVIRTRKFASTLPSFMWMTADEVASQGYEAVMAGKPVYVNGHFNRLVARLARALPDAVFMKTARRQIVDD